MRKLFCVSIVAMAIPLLSGCFGKGSSADPPANFQAQEGDGRVMLTWNPVPDVDFWIFTATDPNVTAFNWTGLPNSHVYISASTPFYVCGLYNGTQYYFAANGRANGGPGGTSSPTITTANPPYNASAGPWTTGTSSAPDLYGVGYTSLTTCSNNATSAAGIFAAVGASGTILTSLDGKAWVVPATVPSGLPDLYAVAGYYNPTTPAQRWVAVGNGSASVYSTDKGVTWIVGSAYNAASPALRSITQVSGKFFAVGDAASGAGTILSSTDGITWTSHTSGTANNLNGITHGNYYVAVGDSGTILTSPDGNTWTTRTSNTSVSLRKVAYYGNIIVAVGDGGTIVTSINNDVATWTSQTLPTTPSLVSVAAESQFVANAVADAKLNYISTAQFVAVDSGGTTYTSQNGIDWTSATSTGISTNALLSSGFGYVAVGVAGATAYAF